MRPLRTVVALGLSTACGIALIAQGTQASGLSTTGLDATIRATLDEVTADGWNPATNGLYINWSSVDPTQVNFTDHKLSRHDPLTDLRDLDNMERYEQQHPGDRSQQAGIARLYPVVTSEFHGSTSNVGWVYWELLDLTTVSGDPAWTSDAASMATAMSTAIDPATGLIHEHLTDNGKSCSDGYRVDATLERALMLVDAGKRFADATWTQQGHRAYTAVRAAGLNPTYHLYAREICKGTVIDAQAKVEEQSDEARDGILAGEYVGDSTLVNDGISLLDTLVANATGLHDTVDGGWCPLFDMRTATLDCHVKLSRQYLLLRAFHDADQVDSGRYGTEETELLDLVPRMVTPSPHPGFLFERARDFTLYKGENWITGEADGIVVDALQHVLGDQGTTTTSTTGSTSSSTTTTTTRTTTTTSTSSRTTTTATTTRTSTTSSSSSTTTSGAGCPSQTHTTTGTVSGSSQSVFVTAGGSTLCATLSWAGGAAIDLIVYDHTGTTVLGQVTTGVSPESLRIATTAGTVYKVKVKPISGSAAYTLTTAG